MKRKQKNYDKWQNLWILKLIVKPTNWINSKVQWANRSFLLGKLLTAFTLLAEKPIQWAYSVCSYSANSFSSNVMLCYDPSFHHLFLLTVQNIQRHTSYLYNGLYPIAERLRHPMLGSMEEVLVGSISHMSAVSLGPENINKNTMHTINNLQ